MYSLSLLRHSEWYYFVFGPAVDKTGLDIECPLKLILKQSFSNGKELQWNLALN